METNKKLILVSFVFVFISSIIILSSIYSGFPDFIKLSDSQDTVSSVIVASVCGDNLCNGEETCSTCSLDCGECPVNDTFDDDGGGGGRQVNFEFDPDFIQEKLFQEDSLRIIVKIKNIGNVNIIVDLSVFEIENLVFISDKTIDLKVNEIKEFEVIIITGKATNPDVYLGDIIGKAEDVERRLPIVLRISEKDAPINLDVTVPEDKKTIASGDEAIGEITIINDIGNINVPIEYSIRNRDREIVASRSETIDLELGGNFFIERLITELNTPPGNYLFYASLTYNSKEYIDAANFRIEARSEFPGLFIQRYLFYGIGIGILIVLLILLLSHLSRKRKKKKLVKEIRIVDYFRLIERADIKIKIIRAEVKKTYNIRLIEKYSTIMKDFFSIYYSVKPSLTFQELIRELNKKNIRRKSNVIAFIKRISLLPYYGVLIPKIKFEKVIRDTIILLNYYNKEKIYEKKINKNKKKLNKPISQKKLPTKKDKN